MSAKNLIINKVRRGSYLDSVALLQLSRKITEINGVAEAAVMMGTPANKEILDNAGLLHKDDIICSGDDIIIALRTISEKYTSKALEETERLLEQRYEKTEKEGHVAPSSIRKAVNDHPELNIALISVPGMFAAAEARKALRRGLNVMLFSDNVPISQEVELKKEAKESGLLMMGPDCGTAILNGVPIAFANKLLRGNIGVIGASGTGVQEVTSLLSRNNYGVSQVIGVGGRDLEAVVGGITTLMAIDALAADPQTKKIILISKPPSLEVTNKILERIKDVGKPFTICFLGIDNLQLPKNAIFVPSLKRAAESVMKEKINQEGFNLIKFAGNSLGAKSGICGLFSGGSLCLEAQVVFREAGLAITSNAPAPKVNVCERGEILDVFLDLGADEFTIGKPHPMIDPSVRDEAVFKAVSDPKIGVIIIDIVLGYGAHPDPAGHLSKALGNKIRESETVVISSITGTHEDPQGFLSQKQKLQDLGILIAPSNFDAAELAIKCLSN